ncbi:MAG: hypothetical protein AB1861_30545 [Cyanobacteriota bacterium]
MPGRRGSMLLTAVLPPVMGSLLEFQPAAGKTAFRLFITGDTLANQQLKEIPQRYSDIDLALLHLCGTEAFGILLIINAKQGV